MRSLVLLLAVGVWADTGLELTIYNDDLALVKDRRELDLPKGRTSYPWEGVAQTLDATSASFQSPGAWMLEQNYRYDLVNRSVLLQKYLGKEITLVREVATQDGRTVTSSTTGRILSVEGERITSLESEGKILLDPPGRVVLPSLPEGLLVKPSLVIDLNSPKGGRTEAELRYLCKGLSWKADYIVVLDSTDHAADIDGLVTLNNLSGTSFRDARLKLVAGDVNTIREQSMPMNKVALRGAMLAMDEAAPAPQFQESGLLEYHLYSLQRPASVLDREQKQVSLLSAHGAKVAKRFVFDESIYQKFWWWNRNGEDTREGLKCAVVVDVENKENNRLGMALPKGKIRVYKADAQGQLQFVGEDQIDHTPRDETLHLTLGQAFDIRGKRVVESSDQKNESKTETVSVSLHNSKDEDIVVEVVEHQNWPTWKVKESSLTPQKKDAGTIVFEVKVPKRGDATVRYTYWASWK